MRSIILFSVLFVPSLAGAATITFKDGTVSDFVQSQDQPVIYTSITSLGFTFSSVMQWSGAGEGSINVAPSGVSTEGLVIEQTESKVFSLDALAFQYVDSIYPVNMTGYLVGGGTVQIELPLLQSRDESMLIGWSGLTKVEIENASGAFGMVFDTFEVTAVPIPAAVWLFGSALAGLGWMRRKKTVFV